MIHRFKSLIGLACLVWSKHRLHSHESWKTCIERIYCISMSQPMCRNGLKLFFQLWNRKQKTVEIRINMLDNTLRDIVVWLLLYNIVADKHILLSVFYFRKRNKMFWRCIIFWCIPTLLCAVASDVAIGKGRGLLWAVLNHGCIRTSYTPPRKL